MTTLTRPAVVMVLVLGAMLVGAADATPAGINTRDIVRGVVPRDAIPALVLPQFDAVKEAGYMREADRVVAVEVGGEARAYPVRILEQHEIINDVVGGAPLTVTY